MEIESIKHLFDEKLTMNCYQFHFFHKGEQVFTKSKFVSNEWKHEKIVDYFEKSFTDISMNLKQHECIINLLWDNEIDGKYYNNFNSERWLVMHLYTLEGTTKVENKEKEITFSFVAPGDVQTKDLIQRVHINSLKKIYVTCIEKGEECWLHC